MKQTNDLYHISHVLVGRDKKELESVSGRNVFVNKA
jgi:hypothetical protein